MNVRESDPTWSCHWGAGKGAGLGDQKGRKGVVDIWHGGRSETPEGLSNNARQARVQEGKNFNYCIPLSF